MTPSQIHTYQVPGFENRPVRVVGRPTNLDGMAFYLHGISSDPFAYEREICDMVSARFSAMGVTTIIPLGSKGCFYLDVPMPDARCWDLRQVNQDHRYFMRILEFLQANCGFVAPPTHILGYSNGAYLISEMLQAGLLHMFDRIGMMAGGQLNPHFKPEKLGKSNIFIEISRDDPDNAMLGIEFAEALRRSQRGANLHARIIAATHAYDADQTGRFLDWFLGTDASDEIVLAGVCRT